MNFAAHFGLQANTSRVACVPVFHKDLFPFVSLDIAIADHAVELLIGKKVSAENDVSMSKHPGAI